MADLVHILLVEDDEVDVEIILESFRKAHIGNPVTVAADGVEALELLRGDGDRAPLSRPNLVLLDINMPRMDGHEFLTQLRADPRLHDSLVFMITTSDDEVDRFKAYEKNVAGYIVKTDPARTFMDAVSMLEHYWRVVEFPT